MATILAVSPHLDDAVLSYGGRLAALARAGHDVVVFTVFAGSPQPPYSPAATAFHGQWDATGDPVEPRRAEDRAAQAVLGTTALHGTHLDAIYRRDEDGDWLIRTGEPTEVVVDEPVLLAAVTATIERLIGELRPAQVLTCAAIGAHVDHRRARDATVLAAARHDADVRLWADFPYVTWADLIPPLPDGRRAAEPVAEVLTAADEAKRNAALRCYESQLAMLEEDGIPLPVWFAEHCAGHAAPYGLTGTDTYEVVRRVLAPAPGNGAGDGSTGTAGVRRHPDLQPK